MKLLLSLFSKSEARYALRRLFSPGILGSSWILTSLFFLLTSSQSFLTLEYVRQISLGGFVFLWILLYLSLSLPRLFRRDRWRPLPSLLPCAGLCLAAFLAESAGVL